MPQGISLFEIVMLPNPIVPLCPVTLKDNVVVVAVWLLAMVALDICELVMLLSLLMMTSMVVPVVVATFIVEEISVGVEFGVGVGAAVGLAVGVGIGVAVGVGVGVAMAAATVIGLLLPAWLFPSKTARVIEPTLERVTDPVQTPEVKEPEVEGEAEP